jgi:hypothetical protein
MFFHRIAVRLFVCQGNVCDIYHLCGDVFVFELP